MTINEFMTYRKTDLLERVRSGQGNKTVNGPMQMGSVYTEMGGYGTRILSLCRSLAYGRALQRKL